MSKAPQVKENVYDAIVIGSGPAGEGAAMTLTKSGKRVAIVEKHVLIGGGCTHWGTIPSKSLRHTVQQIADFRDSKLFRRRVGPVDITWPDLLASANDVIKQQSNMRENFYHRNRVDMFNGLAHFTDKHTVVVVSEDGSKEHLTADQILIATGSRPYRPDDIDFRHARVRDSDTILEVDFVPRNIIIYGAGVIGSEYASIFGNLGLKVDLVNTRDKLLAFMDDEITDALSYHLREHSVTIRHNEEYERVETQDDHVVMHLKSGKRLKADLLLWANGRSGNTEALKLEAIKVKTNHRGQIEINENYQTSQTNVYAVGDVAGGHSLASTGYDEGRFAGTHIAKGVCDSKLIENMPTGIYTNPEISSVGRTESELTEQKIPYEVGRAFFRSIARAQITGHTTGMVKLLFHAETLEILGIHCFGQQASEIVHIGQAIMSQPSPNNTINYFIETTFNYPTMAEAYRVAAFNGLNRVR